MIPLPTLTPDDKGVRTQITLTKQLKKMVEEVAALKGESLSEYLRNAALARLKTEQKEQEDRVLLVQKIIGSLKNTRNPAWKDKKSIYRWSRKIREEW